MATRKIKKIKAVEIRSKFLKVWRDHPNYTALVHTALGMGLGILAQNYVEAGYINSIGYLLVVFGVLGHLYAFVV